MVPAQFQFQYGFGFPNGSNNEISPQIIAKLRSNRGGRKKSTIRTSGPVVLVAAQHEECRTRRGATQLIQVALLLQL